jgi:hypothetical protein
MKKTKKPTLLLKVGFSLVSPRPSVDNKTSTGSTRGADTCFSRRMHVSVASLTS